MARWVFFIFCTFLLGMAAAGSTSDSESEASSSSSSSESESSSSSSTYYSSTHCSKICKGKHEIFLKQKSTCPPETCESLIARYDCSKAPPKKPGCACKPGFKRLKKNSPCIPICECPQKKNSVDCQPKCKGPNEEYVLKKQTCPPEICKSLVAKYDCSKEPPRKPGCACKSGFLRQNETAPCKKICDCKEMANSPDCLPKCKGPNEEYVLEKQTCPPEICRSLVAKFDCSKEPPRKPGCACKSGFLRQNETAPCKKICECKEMASSPDCLPKCEGPNEEYVLEKQTCPPDTCRSLVAKYDCSKEPPRKPGCACKSGFLRQNETAPCKKICDCKEMASSPDCLPKCKGPNEEYVLEKQTCPPEICKSLVAKFDCSKEPPRKPGCACKSGFLRQNETAPCKKICECKEMASSPDCLPKCEGPNEEYVLEKQTCPPEVCKSLVAKYDCSNETPRKPGCACKSGFLRQNETAPCKKICDCKEMESSPDCLPKCEGPNEEYVEAKRTCPPETCLSMIAFFDCRNAAPEKPGCACKPGYLRANDTSACMPSTECGKT